ncbi:MAG: NAD-dependent epimerase/dehydratase [Verrucomicrobiales bacterium]|nr:NAD-dependent epimerase/dehydratase [Verrucomicrobiales bacterium]
MKRVILAGGSGFIGGILAKYFHKAGYEIVILSRAPRGPSLDARTEYWDGRTVGAWAAELEGADAVINLAGRSVDCRYTLRNRKLILDSRLDSTRVLGEAIKRCGVPPRVWLNSSTATIYKHSLDQPMDETGEIGSTPEAQDAFSIEVARRWERAFEQVVTPQTRKIALRSAMVLGHGRNSVFPVLRRLVRFGLGGNMASGKQFVSWIHQTDFCRAVEWLLEKEDFNGPVNLAAPNPVTNQEMMRILREICRAPVGLPSKHWMIEIGAFFLRTEPELIIKSRRVIPGRLLKSGFQFEFRTLREAFEDLVHN